MIIHFHHANIPNAGELKRMKNIDRYVAGHLSDSVVEVEFYNRHDYKFVHKKGQFTLSPFVKKKYYIMQFPKLKRLNCIYKSLVLSLLGLIYRPSFIIGELCLFQTFNGIFRFFVPRCKIIFDIHGAAVEEAEYQGLNPEKIEWCRFIENYSLHSGDYILCQSDEMKRYIADTYKISPEKICVFRCGVDMEIFHIKPDMRNVIRDKLGIHPQERLFVYSGGLHPWQRIEESLSIFKSYYEDNNQSKFLVITGDRERLMRIVREKFRDIESKVLTVSLPFEQVPDYLNAADVAFLLRHNHMMNAVASPTKLAEYMACGLPVITSKVAEKWVTEDGLKYFLLEEEINKDISKVDFLICSVHKEDISSYAEKHLSLEEDCENITTFFGAKA